MTTQSNKHHYNGIPRVPWNLRQGVLAWGDTPKKKWSLNCVWRNSRSWTANVEKVGRVQENSMSRGMAWDTGCKAGAQGINYRWGKKDGQRPSNERSCELFQGIWSLTYTTASTFWTLNILNSLTSHLWPSTFHCSCCSKGAQWPPSWPIQWNLTCFF